MLLDDQNVSVTGRDAFRTTHGGLVAFYLFVVYPLKIQITVLKAPVVINSVAAHTPVFMVASSFYVLSMSLSLPLIDIHTLHRFFDSSWRFP